MVSKSSKNTEGGNSGADQILTKNEEGRESYSKSDIGHVNEGFEGIEDEKIKDNQEGFQRKGVRLSQRVRFSESAEIIPEFNGSPQSHRIRASLTNGAHHQNGLLPHGKGAQPLSADGGRVRKERCSKTVICIVCLTTGLVVSFGVVATLAAIFYTRSDFCTTHLKNQALFYIDRLGMTESKDGLFTKSHSKLLNRFKTSNITVVQYVVQNGHKLSWIRPSSPMQILWNNGASFKTVFIRASGGYNVTYLGDPMKDKRNLISQTLQEDGWYAGRPPDGIGHISLTVISEGTSWKTNQTRIIQDVFSENPAILKLIKEFK